MIEYTFKTTLSFDWRVFGLAVGSLEQKIVRSMVGGNEFDRWQEKLREEWIQWGKIKL